jgi:hypothetical protein
MRQFENLFSRRGTEQEIFLCIPFLCMKFILYHIVYRLQKKHRRICALTMVATKSSLPMGIYTTAD